MPSSNRTGFTLIELMIVVAILGILAALAIPSFVGYIRRSKTVEATTNVNNMFKAAATYYLTEFNDGRSAQAQHLHHCTIDEVAAPFTPIGEKQTFDYYNGSTGFKAIGFTLADPHFYAYEIGNTEGAHCNNQRDSPALYTFRATGDLDGDGVFSTFELATGSDQHNQLFHAPAFYIEKEIE